MIPVGLRHTARLRIDTSFTVPAISPKFAFATMPAVFATAFLVGFVESACVDALRPYLTTDQRTVGSHVNLSHSAATPIGMEVTAEVELVAIDGKRLTFNIVCRDEVELICEGQHERFIVDFERFVAKVNAKART